MHAYQHDFIQLAIKHEALCFGDYTLKSGRKSPYFFNAGKFQTGEALMELGRHYAQAIVSAGLDFDMVFGPAYKGIPLAASTAIAMADQHNLDLPYCFNRKEKKNHGEGGNIVGAALKGRVLIIDDVITAGTAIREVMSIILEAGAKPAAVVIGLNRQEKGKGGTSAIAEVEKEYGVPVISIVNLDHIIDYLDEQGEDVQLTARIRDYRKSYGVG